MRDIQAAAGYADIVKARSHVDPNVIVEVGIKDSTFRKFESTKQATKVAQYYGNVQDGLIEAQHAFLGLKRPHELDGDMNADKRVIIYSWRPEYDWVWLGSRSASLPERRSPPPRLVFAVLMLLENQEEQGVSGSIVQWNWIAEDSKISQAPLDWESRYQEKLWSR
jgi:hypothetical protein